MNTPDRLIEKIEQGPSLDFGQIFNQSIELFKKTWLQGFLMFLFTLLIMLPLIVIFYVPFLGMIIAQQEGGYNDTEAFNSFFGGMSVLYILLVIVGFLVLGAVASALNAGFYRIMHKLDCNEVVETSDYWFFVKKDYLGKIFVLMIVSVLIAIPSALLCYIPLIYMIVPLSFFMPVFTFNSALSVGDIIKVSFKIANKNWLVAFGLIIVASILSQILGYLLCGIGLLFTATFVYHPIFIIYKSIIGFGEKHAIDEIGTSLE